jgi:hypothetical protein
MNEQLKKNESRVDRFIKARKAAYDENDSIEEDIIDMLTDLQHYCLMFEVDFDEVLEVAVGHFDNERTNYWTDK